MSAIAASLENLLTTRRIAYEVLAHESGSTLRQVVEELGISVNHVARAVVLRSGSGFILAVLPLTYLIDFTALEKLTGESLENVSATSVSDLFPDCERGAIPVLGTAYKLRTYYDSSLRNLDFVVFEAGNHHTLIRVHQDGFIDCMEGALCATLAHPESHLSQPGTRQQGASAASPTPVARLEDFTPSHAIEKRIGEVYELPPLPAHVQQILQLRDNPLSTTAQLADLVESDPSLSSQVLRYARSPLFGGRDDINTVEAAINRVLGYDMVLNLALGLSALKSFRMPLDGPLGLKKFMQHGGFSAELCRRFKGKLAGLQAYSTGQVYLAGLLHNFGFLLLGHLFQPEFFLLNRLIAANPHLSVREIEQQMVTQGQARVAVSISHTETGAWLLQHWNLPPELVLVSREHHNEQYQGEHRALVCLVMLVDRLLKANGTGDGCSEDIPQDVLDGLGVGAENLDELREETRRVLEAGAVFA